MSAARDTSDRPSLHLFVVQSLPGARPDELPQHVPAHIDYMVALEKQGALIMSGPFLDTSGKPSPSGMWILRASSREEASALAAGDPFHHSGARTFRIEEWQLHQGRIGISIDLSDGSNHLY